MMDDSVIRDEIVENPELDDDENCLSCGS